MANLLNYTNYDFTDLTNQLQARVQAVSGTWKDIRESATGQMLLELYAYVGNLIGYYIERRAEECYIGTAQLLSSVINIVRILNFLPARQISAQGFLTFSIAAPISLNVYIPKYTSCQSNVGIKYLTSQDFVLLAGQSSVTVPCIQGQIVSVNQASNGAANQIYNINDTNIENTNLFVYVANALWNQVSSFVASTATSPDYMLRTEMDGTVSVMFNDGISGMIPPGGAQITMQYVKTDGVNGNAYSSGVVTTINSVLHDDSQTVQTLTVTNTDPILGGAGAQTIDQIKALAPQVFNAGGRLVTKADHIAILKNYGGIAEVNVWGEYEAGPPLLSASNKVFISLLMQNWIEPSASFKEILTAYIFTMCEVGAIQYQYVDPVIIHIVPEMDIKCMGGTSLPNIQAKIVSALDTLFVLGTTALLGQAKRVSDFTVAIENVDGVAYSHTTLKIQQDLLPSSGPYAYAATMNVEPLLAGSVELWSGSELVATDNDGSWVAESSIPTVSGGINYVTGAITATLTPTTANEVYVRYQQNNTGSNVNDIVVGKEQICNILTTVFTDISYE